MDLGGLITLVKKVPDHQTARTPPSPSGVNTKSGMSLKVERGLDEPMRQAGADFDAMAHGTGIRAKLLRAAMMSPEDGFSSRRSPHRPTSPRKRSSTPEGFPSRSQPSRTTGSYSKTLDYLEHRLVKFESTLDEINQRTASVDGHHSPVQAAPRYDPNEDIREVESMMATRDRILREQRQKEEEALQDRLDEIQRARSILMQQVADTHILKKQEASCVQGLRRWHQRVQRRVRTRLEDHNVRLWARLEWFESRWEKQKNQLATSAFSKVLKRTLWKCFASLKTLYTEKKEREGKLQTALYRLKNRTGHLCFRSWADDVKATKQSAQERARTKAERLLHLQCMLRLLRFLSLDFESQQAQALRTALLDWRQMATSMAVSREKFSRFQKTFGNLKNRSLAQAARTWTLFVQGEKGREEQQRRAVMFMIKSAEAKAFKKWAAVVAAVRAAKKQMARVSKALHHSKLAAAWRTYVSFIVCLRAEEEKKGIQKKMMERIVKQMKNRTVASAYNSWAIGVRNKRVVKERMERVSKALGDAQASKGFRTWRAFAISQGNEEASARVRNKLLAQIVGKMKYQTATIVFKAWATYTRAVRVAGGALAKLSGQWEKYAKEKAIAAFRRNVAAAVKADRHLEKMKKTMRKWKQGLVNRCLMSWKAIHQQEMEQKKYRERLLKKVISKIRLKMVTLTFGAWSTTVMEKRQKQQEHTRKLRKFFAWMSQKGLVLSFGGLKTFYLSQRRTREIMTRVCASWEKGELARGFRCLKNMASKTAAAEKALERTKRAIASWQRGAMVQTFVAWKNCFEQNKQMEGYRQRLLNKFRAQYHNREVAKTFNTWRSNFIAVKRFKSALLRVGNLWAQKDLAGGMMAFRICAQQGRQSDRARERANNLLLRWKHRLVALSFASWHKLWVAAVELRAYRAALLNKFIATWRNRGVSKVFIAWNDLRLLKHQVQRVAKKTLLRWQNGVTSLCFNSWYELVTDKARKEKFLERFAKKWMNRTTSKVFHTWIGIVEWKRGVRNVIGRHLSRWKNRTISNSFQAWQDHWSSAKEVKKYKERLLYRFVANWKMRTVSKIFLVWTSKTESMKRMRVASQRCLKRWTNRLTSSTFVMWQQLIVEKHERLQKMNRFLLSWKNKEVARVFLAWSGIIHWKAQVDNVAAKTMAKWMNRLSSGAFEAWRELVVEKREKETTLGRFLLRWRNKDASKCFLSWCQFVRSTKKLRRIAAKGFGRWKNRQLAACVVSWKTLMEMKRESCTRERLLARFLGKWRNRELSRLFREWEGFVLNRHEARRVQEGKLRKATGKLTFSLAARSFTSWATFVARNARRRRQRFKRIKNFILRWIQLRTSKSFHGWRSVLERNRVYEERILVCKYKRQDRLMEKAFFGFRANKLKLKFVRQTLLRVLQYVVQMTQSRALHTLHMFAKEESAKDSNVGQILLLEGRIAELENDMSLAQRPSRRSSSKPRRRSSSAEVPPLATGELPARLYSRRLSPPRERSPSGVQVVPHRRTSSPSPQRMTGSRSPHRYSRATGYLPLL